MSTRTDIHSPTNLVTEDYEYVGCGYYGGPGSPGFSPINTPTGRALLDEGWHFDDVHGGAQCSHCGAHIKYYAILKHKPTHTLIHVGEICLDNRFELATAEFHRLRKAAKLDRERQRIVTAREAWKAEHADEYAFLADRNEKSTQGDERYNDFYASLWNSLKNYGNLSERQLSALQTSITKWQEREARQAEQKANATPVIEGRIQITGKVISTKIDYESIYGPTEKLLVEDDRGFRLYGTLPRALGGVERGDRVTFKASVTKSRNDESFGFYKRPADAHLDAEPVAC